MTAIALLNADIDPHIVSDSLLSVDGAPPQGKEKIWLPAVGWIRSEWKSNGLPYHVNRLGRKTFALPNHSGILCFAGDGMSAYRFWAALSAKWQTASGYDQSLRVDDAMLQSVFREHAKDVGQLSIFGALIDAAGNRTAVSHNFEKRMETEHYGTCYVAGTGAQLIAKIIQRRDQCLTRKGGWTSAYPASATEDLAEHISFEMLHVESSVSNGVSEGTPLDLRCGGYYDWSKIEPAGVRPMSPRVDLCVSVTGSELVVTRAYFIEHTQLIRHARTNSQRICTSVTNLGIDIPPIAIPENWADGHRIVFEESWGTAIPSFFFAHHLEDELFQGSLFGRLDKEFIESNFSPALNVHRIRVAIVGGSDTTIRSFINQRDKSADGVLSAVDGKLSLWLSPTVLAETVQAAARASVNAGMSPPVPTFRPPQHDRPDWDV